MADPTAQSLLGTEWTLEDLSGAGVLDRLQTTLAFPQAGRGGRQQFVQRLSQIGRERRWLRSVSGNLPPLAAPACRR